MAPPRSYSYALLQQLVVEHPDWSYQEYAKALTADMRKTLNDPGYPAVLSNSVAAAISRYRERWADEGVAVPEKGPKRADLIPWQNIPEKHKMHVYLRKLRTLAMLRRGEHPSNPREERQARQFERELRQAKQVVDLGPLGRPLLRPAEPWELDSEGELIDVVAMPEPAKKG